MILVPANYIKSYLSGVFTQRKSVGATLLLSVEGVLVNEKVFCFTLLPKLEGRVRACRVFYVSLM